MSSKNSSSQTISASPTKQFFVHMLTRDIELQDAILDLLDNCMDGVLRTIGAGKHRDKPFAGFRADIAILADRFQIADNCGGIPVELARHSAFRLGRPPETPREDIPTVGMYGIGMKRAIFKLGRECQVRSQSDGEGFSVHIPPKWFEDENDWYLPIEFSKRVLPQPGTTIEITKLEPEVAARFSKEGGFEQDFRTIVAQHYSMIIEKGFEVRVGNKSINSMPLQFMGIPDIGPNYKEGIAPYIFQAELDGVHVDLVVGFYKPVPDEDEIEEETEHRFSADNAGWTIVCNDRVVVYRDRSILTGWGEADVPTYHNQFNSIAGLVQFTSNDPLSLPVTTTKRGIDASSPLYLQVKNKMREGMKIFTSYTNRLKKDRARRDELFENSKGYDIKDIAGLRSELHFKPERNMKKASYFAPALPIVERADSKIIRFTKPIKEIQILGKHFFDDRDAKPGQVGEACFDSTLKQVRKK